MSGAADIPFIMQMSTQQVVNTTSACLRLSAAAFIWYCDAYVIAVNRWLPRVMCATSLDCMHMLQADGTYLNCQVNADVA